MCRIEMELEDLGYLACKEDINVVELILGANEQDYELVY